MRPILLTFSGCRSYVEPQTIDFAGKQFVAIVGDTGAGKSTVLDAICYGLYNRCSWHGGTVSDLVAHGGDGTLSVEFTFSVADKTWRVERSTTPRTAAPAHKLVDVDTDTVVATGAHAATAQIRRVIGLDYDTFLRAVILPQGRFHELLRMGDTDRSKILKSVLGLDQLGAVRGHAQALHARLAVRLAEYREHRGLFLPDPGQTLIDATERLRAAQERLDRLQAAQDAIAAAMASASADLERKTALERVRDRLDRAIPDQADARYRAMLTTSADITARQQELERQRMEALDEQRSVQSQLDDAERHGTGVAAVASTLSTLTVLAKQLPQLDAQAIRLRNDDREIKAARADLDSRKTALAELGNAVAAAKEVFDGAESRMKAVGDSHAAAHATVTAYRKAAERARQADERVAACQREVEKLAVDAQAAATDAAQAAETVAERETEQARSVKKRAAAIAGAGCTAGDPCPICARTLPADFTAPADEATKAPDDAVRAARTAASQAAEKATAAAVRARIAEQDTLATAIQQATDATAALSPAKAHVYEALGNLLSQVDLDTPDDDLLRPFNDAVAIERSEHIKAEDAFRDAKARHLQAASELPVREQALAARQAKHQCATADHAKAVIALHDAARELPTAFRLADDTLFLTDIGCVRAAAQQRQDELVQLTNRLAATRVTLDRLDGAQQQLDDELVEQVTEPVNTIRRQLDRLIDRAADAEALLDLPPHPPRPADSALTDEAAWCTAMLQHTAQLVTACTHAAQHARQAAVAAGEAAERARRGCGADNDDHLEQLVRLASTASHNASRDITKATAHQPLADELERRISGAAPAVAALADLVALLADGKFIADAVRQRQLALLSAASQTLLTITGGRFGFADNFRIIDTDTAQPRDVRTLSGGETFQASLALALAVVELAGRASGRVDSLFLDEGFGSLDSGMLREALTALAAHSTAGRLVTVISHMRSITEDADHVLVVKRPFAGSRAYWATPEEREQIINDDLGRGQL